VVPAPEPEQPKLEPSANPAPPQVDFDSLVQEVEKSLGTPAAAAAPEPAPAAAAAAPNTKEKSDDDLIAEFEKMLKS
jgi:ribosomal protein L12E/L44/L45/RPP1/RPP2